MHEKHEPDDNDLSIDNILSALNTKASQDLARKKALYDLAMNNITRVHSNILQRVQPTYKTYYTGYVNFVDGLRKDLGFTHFATHDHRFVSSFLIKVLGDELVVFADGASIYRTEIDAPEFSEDLDKAVERIFLGGLKKLIDNPPQ